LTSRSKSLLCSSLFPPRDVAGDLRGADDVPVGIGDGRKRQRNVQQSAILVTADRLVMLEGVAAADAVQNVQFFIETIRMRDYRDRLPNRLLCCVADQPLRSAVPAYDNAAEVYADDRLVGWR
jgi:hypothetical protein